MLGLLLFIAVLIALHGLGKGEWGTKRIVTPEKPVPVIASTSRFTPEEQKRIEKFQIQQDTEKFIGIVLGIPALIAFFISFILYPAWTFGGLILVGLTIFLITAGRKTTISQPSIPEPDPIVIPKRSSVRQWASTTR